jgi:hypothetical protein
MTNIFNEIKSDVDVARIKADIDDILKLTPYHGNQIALQYSRVESWDAGIPNAAHEIADEEYDYVNWHSALDGTYLKSYMSALQFPVAHARIMRLPPKTCYTTHVDYYTRFHIPVVSKPLQTFMIFPDKDVIVRMYPGKMYWTNTHELHNFVNGTFEDRIHIVFNNAKEPKNLTNDYLYK